MGSSYGSSGRRLEAVVIGGGMVGVSAAEYLRRDGHQVTLIDRTAPGDPAQTSYGNAGIITPSSSVPVPVPGLVAKLPRMMFSSDGPLFIRWRHIFRLAPWLVRHVSHANRRDLERTAAALASIVDQHRPSILLSHRYARRAIHSSSDSLLYQTRC